MPLRAGMSVSDVRRAFLAEYARGVPVKVLMDLYAISKSSAYELIHRFLTMPLEEAVADRSRAPIHRPTKLGDDVTARTLELLQFYPHWGPRKLHNLFSRCFDDAPSVTSIANIMKDWGFTTPETRRRSLPAPKRPRAVALAPNDIWAVDHKGKMEKLGLEPLTVIDVFSRFWLCCRPFTDKSYLDTRRAFEKLFDEFGLPVVMRVDAGQPWVSASGPLRLTQLSAWWVSLGIVVEIVPAPQFNGHVERLNGTIERDVDTSKRVDVRRHCEKHRRIYNEERPHEALDMAAPVEVYVPSTRRPVERRPDYNKLECDEVRSITSKGCIHWDGELVFVSEALVDHKVGLRRMDATSWDVYLHDLTIGVFDDDGFTRMR